MKDIVIGTTALTIDINAGDIYPIKYESVGTLSVANFTDDSIFISENANFEFENNVGDFLTIASGSAYNDYMFDKNGENIIYIKAISDGYISIVRKRW